MVLLIGNCFKNSKEFDLIDKSVLILGDSHTETSLNDTLFKQSFNFAQSAEVYLYSYIKMKRIFKQKKHFDKMILSYSSHNILKPIDKWYSRNDNLHYKLSNNFYLMGFEELFDLFCMNPFQFSKTYFSIVSYKSKGLLKLLENKLPLHDFNLGGHLKLLGNKINLDTFKIKRNSKELEYSELQLKYLKKIYALAIEKHIALYLINTPEYFNDAKNNKLVSDYKSKYFPNAIYIDEVNCFKNKKLFYDNDHLNYKGSYIFTKKMRTLLMEQTGNKQN